MNLVFFHNVGTLVSILDFLNQDLEVIEEHCTWINERLKVLLP